MGLLPTPNHVALIRDCYVQPHSSSSSSPSASAPLPQPASNALSKLTFYAVNRPTKIPKVVAHLVERASKARASSGPKARADLAVTVDIVRGLVVETGESGKEGAGELIKGAMAEEALRVAEMALGGEGGKGDLFSTAQVRSGKRDPEMEARGASLVRPFSLLRDELFSPCVGLTLFPHLVRSFTPSLRFSPRLSSAATTASASSTCGACRSSRVWLSCRDRATPSASDLPRQQLARPSTSSCS